MKATRTITNKDAKGQTTEIIITRTVELQDKIAYADGWNVNLGKETIDNLKIEIYVNGNQFDQVRQAPQICDPKYFAKVIAQGAYARLGKGYLTRERYDLIMATIAEIDAELAAEGNSEFVEVKNAEIAHEQEIEKAEKMADAEYANKIKNGLCPVCGTYCDGDCQA